MLRATAEKIGLIEPKHCAVHALISIHLREFKWRGTFQSKTLPIGGSFFFGFCYLLTSQESCILAGLFFESRHRDSYSFKWKFELPKIDSLIEFWFYLLFFQSLGYGMGIWGAIWHRHWAYSDRWECVCLLCSLLVGWLLLLIEKRAYGKIVIWSGKWNSNMRIFLVRISF